MSRSAEQIALDEKIARIRKQNEEIIRRKQIIDEEIRNAEHNNAVVNVKKAYDDETDDKPSLYSDSFITHQQKTITYPKLRVIQNHQNNRPRNKQDDMVWRREREEIDNERIRRQKAASGWKREWDADKTLEDQRGSVVDRNQRGVTFRSRGSRLSGNDNHEENTLFQPERRPRADANRYRDVKTDISLRLLPKKSSDNDGLDSECKPTTGYEAREQNSNDRNYNARNDKNSQSETQIELRPTEASRGEIEIGKPLNRFEGNITKEEMDPAKCWQTSGPLNLKRTIHIENDEKPNIVITRVTKYSGTRTLPKTLSREKNYSNRDENMTADLSERLKNIVIRVKNDDKREVQVVDGPSVKAEQTNLKDTPSNVTSRGTKFSELSDTPASKDSVLAFNFKRSSPRQSKVFSFGDAGQSLGLETTASTTPVVVMDDNNDEEWEDVSDEEWEDV